MIKFEGEELTQQEMDQIVSGVRPVNMEFNTFKRLRKAAKSGIQGYLKGKYFFISTGYKEVDTPNGKEYVRQTATYKK